VDFQIIDQATSHLFAAPLRTSVHRLRCARLVHLSAQKPRRLPENPANLGTESKAGQKTIEGKIVLV
jgi:hypothetical protein